MIADFLSLFRVERSEWTKRCEDLYASLKQGQLLKETVNKFSLSADKLD